MSIWADIRILRNDKSEFKYELKRTLGYYSAKYGKSVTAEKGEKFDGATGALDIDSRAWIIHDVLCRDGQFDDGTPCTNWQASKVLADILEKEGRWFRKHTWFLATWLFGGGKSRDNGMW